MKFFSDCSGPCDECCTYYHGGCLAGHGDDDFSKMTQESFDQIIELNKQPHLRKQMLEKFPQFNKS